MRHKNLRFLCLMYDISVLSVCMYDMRLHVDLTLLNIKMFLDTQILQNSKNKALYLAIYLAHFSLLREKYHKIEK